MGWSMKKINQTVQLLLQLTNFFFFLNRHVCESAESESKVEGHIHGRIKKKKTIICKKDLTKTCKAERRTHSHENIC